MPSRNVVTGSKRTVLFTPQVAGSSTLTSGVLDMSGFETAVFSILIGSLTAGQTKGTIQVYAGNLANGSDAALLAGASITIQDADTGKLEVIEVFRPTGFRYLELVITRNTQAAAISSAVVTQYHSKKPPESDDATTVAQTYLVVDPEYSNSALTVTTSTYGNSATQVVTTNRNSS
jgi:hypothetical protein